MKDNITFLTDTPIGTKMYLIVQNRIMTEIWMKEAIYQGYTKHYRTETWSDVHIAPCTIKVTVYHVKFTVDNKPITIVCSAPSYWTGQRGYDTNEHLECGIEFKTKMKIGVTGCLDAYFTSDINAFKNYLDENSALDNIRKNLDEQINRYTKMKDDLNKTVNKIIGE